jgi:hypothetical protein
MARCARVIRPNIALDRNAAAGQDNHRRCCDPQPPGLAEETMCVQIHAVDLPARIRGGCRPMLLGYGEESIDQMNS